jgi:hypothetical protein
MAELGQVLAFLNEVEKSKHNFRLCQDGGAAGDHARFGAGQFWNRKLNTATRMDVASFQSTMQCLPRRKLPRKIASLPKPIQRTAVR